MRRLLSLTPLATALLTPRLGESGAFVLAYEPTKKMIKDTDCKARRILFPCLMPIADINAWKVKGSRA